MLVFILRKLLATIPTILGVAVIIFVLFNLVGGDPVLQMVGKYGNDRVIQELRHEYGLDQPLPVQFLQYLKQIVTFDYGRSYATKQKISQMILRGLEPTLSITIPAFVITTLIALLVALLVAYHRGRWLDRFVVVFCVFGMSVPMLAYILFGQYFLAYKMGWFPIAGYDAELSQRIQYVAMPVLIWVMVSLGYDVRFFRTAILEETQQDYVRTARAKGLAEQWVYLKHVLKNSMVPIVTNVMVELPVLIIGSFLLESFFGIPGLGGITIEALHNSDFPVIKAMATLYSLLLIFGNVLTDIAYTLVDPRVKLR